MYRVVSLSTKYFLKASLGRWATRATRNLLSAKTGEIKTSHAVAKVGAELFSPGEMIGLRDDGLERAREWREVEGHVAVYKAAAGLGCMIMAGLVFTLMSLMECEASSRQLKLLWMCLESVSAPVWAGGPVASWGSTERAADCSKYHVSTLSGPGRTRLRRESWGFGKQEPSWFLNSAWNAGHLGCSVRSTVDFYCPIHWQRARSSKSRFLWVSESSETLTALHMSMAGRKRAAMGTE